MKKSQIKLQESSKVKKLILKSNKKNDTAKNVKINSLNFINITKTNKKSLQLFASDSLAEKKK